MAARKPSASDIKQFRELLLHIRRELAGDIGELENDAFSFDGERPSSDNPADVGSDSFAQEFSLELLARDEATLTEVQEAIERIENGSFGRCEGCEQWIPKPRLQAVPHARYCVNCQRALEQAG